MASLGEIIEEIDAIAKLLNARGASAGTSAIVKAQARAIAYKVKSISDLGATQAISVQDAILKCPFEALEMELAMGAVEEALNKSMTKPNAATGTALSFKGQTLTTPQNYFTQSSINKLLSPATSLHEANDVVIRQYKALGICFGSEQTKKWAIAFNLHFETVRTGTMPSYSRLYQDGQDFVGALGGSKLSCATPGLATYPERAVDLPKHIYDQVYAAEPPVELSLPRLAILANHHVPSRSTSKLLRDAPALGSAGRSASSGSIADQIKAALSEGLAEILNTKSCRSKGTLPGLRVFGDEQVAIRGADHFDPRGSRHRLTLGATSANAVDAGCDGGDERENAHGGGMLALRDAPDGAAIQTPPTAAGAAVSPHVTAKLSTGVGTALALGPTAQLFDHEAAEERALNALINRDRKKHQVGRPSKVGRPSTKPVKAKKVSKYAGLSMEERMRLVRIGKPIDPKERAPVDAAPARNAGDEAPKKAGGETPKKAGGKAPKKAGGKSPKKAGGKAPKKAGNKAPKKAGNKAPKTADGKKKKAGGKK